MSAWSAAELGSAELVATASQELPASYLPFAPLEYLFAEGSRPLALSGTVRSADRGTPVAAFVELWHQVELQEGRWGFAQGPWTSPTDWRGRVRVPVQGAFHFGLAHPGADGVVRPVFLRVTSPGYRTLVAEVQAEPWSDRASVELVLGAE